MCGRWPPLGLSLGPVGEVGAVVAAGGSTRKLGTCRTQCPFRVKTTHLPTFPSDLYRVSSWSVVAKLSFVAVH